MRRLIFPAQFIFLVFLIFNGTVFSQQNPQPTSPRMNLKMKTLGGKQFWSDLYFYRDWRIQQNVHSKHYRLLDKKDVRLAYGDYEQCLNKLNQIRQEKNLKPMSGKAVVLLHGIMRSTKSFAPLQKKLEEQGYFVCPVNYPSTQITIEQAAADLQKVLKSLEGIEEISMIGHSMGGLIMRVWFRDYKDARIKKVVMLGTPNQGAEMADYLKNFLPFQWVMGKAGQQLVTDEEKGPKQLPAPSVPFGIIAGGRGEETNGYNPLIPGDDDGTVTVASTHLKGEADFLKVPSLHMFLMRNAKVIEATVLFLEKGRFQDTAENKDEK